MSLLNSYSFGLYNGHDKIPTEVLKLFEELVENPERQITCASEIVENAFNNRIRLNSYFNLFGYEAKVKYNTKLGKYAKGKKTFHFENDTNSDEDLSNIAKSGGVVLENLKENPTYAKKLQDAYEELLDKDELAYAIRHIKSLEEELFFKEQVDFIGLIEQALNCLPSAIEKVKEICEKYPSVAEYIKIILQQEEFTFSECFA